MNRAIHPRRCGVLVTTEMLFLLPMLVYVALIIMQFVMIHAAYVRVQSAAIFAADQAAQGKDIDDVHEQAGFVLGFLAGADYETRMQYVDADGDFPVMGPGTIEQDDDFVAVGVRIPMGLVTTNYLGLLGGSVNDLHVQSIVCRKLDVDVNIP